MECRRPNAVPAAGGPGRLLDNITWLSAPGSQLATENLPDASRSVPMMADGMREAADRWREHGFDVEMTDLWYPANARSGRISGQLRMGAPLPPP